MSDITTVPGNASNATSPLSNASGLGPGELSGIAIARHLGNYEDSRQTLDGFHTMAALNNEIKAFIVQALACFDSPSQVATAVKEGFGVVVSRQQVETHDPTRKSSKGLAKRWVTLFEDTRASFRSEMVKEPIANRAMRLRALGRMFEEAEAQRHLVMAVRILEQAAKECGDLYTNRRGRGEAGCEVPATPVQVEFVNPSGYTLKP